MLLLLFYHFHCVVVVATAAAAAATVAVIFIVLLVGVVVVVAAAAVGFLVVAAAMLIVLSISLFCLIPNQNFQKYENFTTINSGRHLGAICFSSIRTVAAVETFICLFSVYALFKTSA